ncbi:PREDICTED: putative serine protease K12H4.7-like [Elephantulus edwardii]|uniref:putative serine protease K12H4.7-like n=1 Tax=Elephantulus edwardii TaxID=28737 RepID=UPI0003F0C6E5|nr:PREDICTED: putative serine protease K12H4.7-like [Elephantulus edwardii]
MARVLGQPLLLSLPLLLFCSWIQSSGQASRRYFINTQFYKPGGPVFLMISGREPAIRTFISTRYSWVKYAKKLGALCFLLEHRFYGHSQPTGDLSTESLRYLSSRQALADIVNFRMEIAKSMELTHNKWVLFGSFYGGSLAVWSRLKYPDLFAAAVGSSAIVQPKVNYPGYFEVVYGTLNEHNPYCAKALNEAVNMVAEKLQRQEYYSSLQADFKLCTPVQQDSNMSRTFFLENLVTMGVITFENTKNNSNIVREEKKLSIDNFCDMLTNASLGSPYHRLAKIENILLMENNADCFQTSYSKFLDFVSDPVLTEENIFGERQWLYQACTEFGSFPTMESNNEKHFEIPLRYFLKQCYDVFSIETTIPSISRLISATNNFYGGFNITGSKIIFPNGSLDPWHLLGVTKSISEELPAILIKGNTVVDGETRSPDMRIISRTDSAAVLQARRKIFQTLKNWLRQ